MVTVFIQLVISRSFDLLNSMIYDLKRFVDLRWLFGPVLHSSLDDLVWFIILHLRFLHCPNKSRRWWMYRFRLPVRLPRLWRGGSVLKVPFADFVLIFVCNRKYVETGCDMLNRPVQIVESVPDFEFCLWACASQGTYATWSPLNQECRLSNQQVSLKYHIFPHNELTLFKSLKAFPCYFEVSWNMSFQTYIHLLC